MTPEVHTRFIVFTTNRSGSEWLISSLNSLPSVTAHGELFLPRKRVAERRWDSEFAYPRYIETQPKGLAPRPFSVFTYLDDLYKTPGAVGFKLMYLQLALYPEIFAYLIRHHVLVIHLSRRNSLDVLLSYAVKAKIGQAHLLSGQPFPGDLTVTLDTENLIRKLRWLQQQRSIAHHLLSTSRLPHIEVVYEDLLQDPRYFQRICDFLDIPMRGITPGSTLVKIRRGTQRDVISNYEQVRQTLAGSQFTELVE